MNDRFRKAVILASSAVAVAYIGYRGIFTLNLTSPYAVFASLFLYVAEIYGIVNMLLFFFQVYDVYEPPQQPVLEGRTVDVFIPTYNEDPELLRTTIIASRDMDYPHRVMVCDDGKREAVRELCAELGVDYMIRPDNRHAKAGNLNHAFEKTDGEFIIIFDADHVPEKHFITRLLGYFADEKLAFVQTPHAYYNFDSFQARLNHRNRQYWEEGQLFYHVIQPGRNKTSSPIFAGSAALFRRSALKEVGYIAVETITEDMHTGLRMHSKGWKSLGIAERMVAGQAPPDVTTFHTQRLRWGEGNLSVLAHDNPLTMKGLSWGQRLCYLATMINWAGGVFKLGIYFTPLLMLFTGVPPVKEFTWGFAVLMGIYMVACILGTKIASNGYGSVWYSELFTMASFWTQIRGTMRAMFLRKFQQFVVTSKRGRQSKSIWPFIRPHIYLIIFSAVALFWAWGRLFAGISDDWFKPMLATFWAFFHMLLAYLVVRRAFWPEDRRYSTRHQVYLPISFRYEANGEPIFDTGTTADLNEIGVAFIAYQALPEGSSINLTIHGPDGNIDVEGEIRHIKTLANDPNGPSGPMAGYRYGIKFLNVAQETTDELTLLCLQYAVPRLYGQYAVNHRPFVEKIYNWMAPRFLRRRFAVRRDYRLPVFLNPDRDGYMPGVTENISREAMSILLPREPMLGEEFTFSMMTPVGPMRGLVKVTRTVAKAYAGKFYYYCVLDFVHLEGQGRVMIQTLFHSGLKTQWQKVLEPEKEDLVVPMNKPLMQGIAYATPALLCAVVFFRFFYADDFFLRNLIAANKPPQIEDITRVDQVYRATMKKSYPSTDRLVLLGQVLAYMDRPSEMAEITKVLAPRDKNNLDLQVALAHAYDLQENFDEAEAAYQKLLQSLEQGRIPASRRLDLMLGAARSSVHSGRLDVARERFRQLLKEYPDKHDLRNEFVGVLLNGNRFQEAVALFETVEPNYEGRVLLVMVHTASKDWASAEREARVLLRLKPDDPTAQGLLADVLNLQGNIRQAEAIYKRLLKTEGADLKIAVQLAHMSLWSKNYEEALERFQTILDQHLSNEDFGQKHAAVLKAYVNAAASAPQLGEPVKKTAIELFNRSLLATDLNDAVFLARLSWVLHRVLEHEKSTVLLERAMAMDPADRSIRMQLAGVLVASNKAPEALKLLEGRENNLDARLLMSNIYVINKDLASAEGILRGVVKEVPEMKQARIALANVLSWKKEYQEATEIFESLAKAEPSDEYYPVRLAEIALWSGDYGLSLSRFQSMLKGNFDRPELWWSFIDAASGAKTLTESQLSLVTAIFEKTQKGDHKSQRVIDLFSRAGRPFKEENFLTRLAWVLHIHVQDASRAHRVLDLVAQVRVFDAADRRELAGVLAATKRFKQALKLYDGIEPEQADLLPLARIHAALDDFKPATELCRKFLDFHPLDKDGQLLLADVLSWQGEFDESLRWFGKLIRMYPGEVHLRQRQAEVVLWSNDYPRALQMFQTLLSANVDQPTLWPGYLEAAANLTNLDAAQAGLVRHILDQPLQQFDDNPRFLGHLALCCQRHLGEKGTAVTLLRQALAAQTKSPIDLARLAGVLYQIGDKKQANAILDQILQQKNIVVAVQKELVDILTSVGRFKEGLDIVDDMLMVNPNDTHWLVKQAELTLWAGNPLLALERLEKALETNDKALSLKRSFIDAAAASPNLSDDQLEIVRRLGNEALTPMPTNDQILYLARIAWVLRREGEQRNQPTLIARGDFLVDQVLLLNPQDAKIRLELAGLLTATGRAAKALAWIEEIAKNNPDDPQTQLRLAEIELANHRFASALGRVEKLLAPNFDQPNLWIRFVDAAAGLTEPLSKQQLATVGRIADQPGRLAIQDRPVVLTRLAWILYREKQPTRANTLLDQALALRPKNLKTRGELVEGALAVGRFQEAMQMLEDLVKEHPQETTLHVKLAQVTLWAGHPNLGVERLHKLLANNFDQPQLWPTFVDAIAGLNKGATTREQLAMVHRIAARPAPDSIADKVPYLSRLAWILYREQEPERAMQILDRALVLQPADGKSKRELAGVLAATGRSEDALKMYQGVELTIDDRFQLVVLHAAAKQFKEAQKHCREILALRPGDKKTEGWLADVTLWDTDYEPALALYQNLLTKEFEQPELWPGYIECAANLKRLTRSQVKLIEQILARRGQQQLDSVQLARQAMAVRKHIENPTMKPALAASILGQLADPLGLGVFEAADVLVAEESMSTPSRKLLFQAIADRPQDPSVLAKLGWIAYQMECRTQSFDLLNEARKLEPKEPGVRREVGDALVATERSRDALAWFEDLAGAYPRDRELQIRLAEVTVWAAEYALGLDRVSGFLERDFELKRLWSPFVDAASSAQRMNDTQLSLAKKLADSPVPGEDADAKATYMSRLAWALHREGTRVKDSAALGNADRLLDKALAIRGLGPNSRLEIAGVLGAAKRFNDALKIYQELVREFPESLELQFHLAQLAVWTGDFAQGLDRLQHLLASHFQQPRLWRTFLDAASGSQKLTAAQMDLFLKVTQQKLAFNDPVEEASYLSRQAWTLIREGKTSTATAWREQAHQYLDRALALNPTEDSIRRELGGVLLAAGKNDSALKMYQGLELTPDDHFQLMVLHAAEKRFDQAEKHGQTFREQRPKDPRGRQWLAQITVWKGKHEDGLALHQQLLNENFQQPELWRSYIDAAAGAAKMSVEQVELLAQIAKAPRAESPDPMRYQIRLAGVLQREGNTWKRDAWIAMAQKTVDSVTAYTPKSADEARELAGLLAGSGQFKKAAELLEKLPSRDENDRFLLASIYAGAQDFASAEKIAREQLAKTPDDYRARFELASILSWNKKAKEALPIFERLYQEKPNDPRLPLKLAETSLWAGSFDVALDRYRKLLKESGTTKAELWKGYIDAAASSSKVSPREDRELVGKIHGLVSAKPGTDATFLDRLAWTLERVGEPQKSIGLLKQALAMNETDRQIRARLAEVLSGQGLTAEAETHYRILLKNGKSRPTTVGSR